MLIALFLWDLCLARGRVLGPIHDVSMFSFHYDAIYELGFTVLHGLRLGCVSCWFMFGRSVSYWSQLMIVPCSCSTVMILMS